MKWFARISPVVFLAMFAFSAARAQDVKEVLFLEDPWPPYTLGEENKAPTGGIGVEMVTEVFKRLGVAAKFQLHPWKRCLKMAEAGEADGLMLVIADPERDAYLALSDVVFDARETLFYRPDRLKGFSWNEFTDLKDYTIGLVNGFTYSDAFAKAIEEVPLKVEYATTSEDNMRKLFAGRVDLIEDDDDVAHALLARHADWKKAIQAAKKPVASFPFHIAIAKKSPAMKLMPEINRVIAEMRADGTMEKILGRTP